MLGDQVRQWEDAGKWVNRGRWARAKNGTLEYLPTKREIVANREVPNVPHYRRLARRGETGTRRGRVLCGDDRRHLTPPLGHPPRHSQSNGRDLELRAETRLSVHSAYQF
jgi:hypothetical protein